MKLIKPMTLATAASVSLLFAVAAYAQPTEETPAAIDAGIVVEDSAPASLVPVEDPAAVVPVNPVEADPKEFGKQVWAKYKSREWLPLVGGVLLVLIFLFRKFASKISKFFDTKKGGYIANFATAAGVTIGLAIWGGVGLSFDLISIAVGSAIIASGGYEQLRDFLGALFSSGKDDKIAKES